MPQCQSRGQKTTCRSLFSPSTICIHTGLAQQAPLPAEPSSTIFALKETIFDAATFKSTQHLCNLSKIVTKNYRLLLYSRQRQTKFTYNTGLNTTHVILSIIDVGNVQNRKKKFSTSYRINKLPEFLQKMIIIIYYYPCMHTCMRTCVNVCMEWRCWYLYVCMQKQEKGVRYLPPSFSTFFFFLKAGSSH